VLFRSAQADRTRSEVISTYPLSVHAAERRLEARFTAARDGDAASAHCSALVPRPAHSIRYCRIRYRTGSGRRVVLLLDAQGHQLVVQP
jgi:hypothetical protein